MKRIIFLLSALLSLKAMSQTQPVVDSAMRVVIMKDGYSNPNFSFENFSASSDDGSTYTKDNLKGKASFINFWSESCPSCMAEMAALNKLYNKYKNDKGFQFLSFTNESDEVIARIKKKYHLNYPILRVDGLKLQAMNFGLGFPSVIITEQAGKISFIKAGGFTDDKQIQQDFDATYAKQIERILYAQ